MCSAGFVLASIMPCSCAALSNAFSSLQHSLSTCHVRLVASSIVALCRSLERSCSAAHSDRAIKRSLLLCRSSALQRT